LASLVIAPQASRPSELPLPDRDVAAIAREVTWRSAKQTLDGIVQQHRERGSRGYRTSAEWVAGRARSYRPRGCRDPAVPRDGKVFYGTQRSRRPGMRTGRAGRGARRQGRRRSPATPAVTMVLAEDSESADVTTPLVDVGAGSSEGRLRGQGREGQARAGIGLARRRCRTWRSASSAPAGILSYQQNQPTGWSGDNLEQIRWGHLDTFSAHPTFCLHAVAETGERA
jgi:hypothetical protein